MNAIKIGGMFGVSKDEFDLPEGWSVSGYLSDNGKLYSLRTNDTVVGEYPNLFCLGFFTKQEINYKILLKQRKIKINKLNENE